MTDNILIVPASPINTVLDPKELFRLVKTRFDPTLQNVSPVLDNSELVIAHQLILEDTDSIDLDLTNVDIYVISTNTSTGIRCVINIGLIPVISTSPRRHNTTIINKGAGTLILAIHNIVDGIQSIRNKILKSYGKYELTTIDDGFHVIIC